jgi:hypothetical protein
LSKVPWVVVFDKAGSHRSGAIRGARAGLAR